MLYYDINDVSEGIDANKTSSSKVTTGILQMKGLSFNMIS